jgi:hypothetical protein
LEREGSVFVLGLGKLDSPAEGYDPERVRRPPNLLYCAASVVRAFL